MGRKAGITEAQLLALADFEGSPEFGTVERLVLRYAAAMTQTPVAISDQAFDQLRGHFNEKQLVELTSAIAWENYRARFDHAFGIGPQGFSEGAFCPLPETKRRSLIPATRNETSEAE